MEECPRGNFNGILYSFPGGESDLIVTAGTFKVGVERPLEARPGPRQAGKKADGEDALRSMRRARAQLRRLALSNEFEYFVTLTLDAARVDRYDVKAITKKLNSWADNMVRRRGLRYILVPERHKDGAIHFHGFMAGEGLEVLESGHRDKTGAMMFNLPQWKLGFSTAIRLRGEYSRAVSYVCKYIGKQDGERPMGRWYYSGGDLQEPPKEYLEVDYHWLVEDWLVMGPLREGEHFPAVPFETGCGMIWVINGLKNGQNEQNGG